MKQSVRPDTENRSLLLQRFLAVQPHVKRCFKMARPGESDGVTDLMHQVTAGQLEALFLLAEHKAGMTMAEFAANLAMTASAATQLADRLVRLDLVDRGADASDRRVVRVSLSTLARGHFDKMWQRRLETMDIVAEALSDDELLTLVKLLEKLAHRSEPTRS